MSTATLSDIITKVRRLTGSGNSSQLSDDQIIDYLNSFYLYDFPAQFRSLKLKDVFVVNTIANVDSYPFDFRHYETLEAPAFIDKRPADFYNNPWPFYGLFNNWQERETFATATAALGAGPYTGTLQNTPIIRSVNNNPIAQSVTSPTAAFATGSYPAAFNEPNVARVQNILIEANTATGTFHVTDDGNGNLIGDVLAGGTINYTTGAIAGLTFDAVIPAGNAIRAHYNPTIAQRPQAILFWQNQLTLRPVPDRGYTIEIVAYRRPSQILLGTQTDGNPNMAGVPELLEWFESLAFGAAKKVFQDRQDEEGALMMDRNLREAYSLNETRTYSQLGSRRIGTIFAPQLDGANSPNGYRYWGNGNV